MADAKKCDRCGIYYETYEMDIEGKKIANGLVKVNIVCKDIRFEQDAIDLCQECMDKFEKWMKDTNTDKLEEKSEQTQEITKNTEEPEEFRKFMMQRFMKKE